MLISREQVLKTMSQPQEGPDEKQEMAKSGVFEWLHRLINDLKCRGALRPI